MKSIALLLPLVLFSTSAFASTSPSATAKIPATSAAVEKAAAAMKASDVRTVVHIVENTDGNPCMSPGESYQVDLEVKKVDGYDRALNKILYTWEVIKSINVDSKGQVMEVCAE